MDNDLREEIKQARPFGSPEEAVYVGIQLTAEKLKAGFNDLFKSHGLTGAQYNALRILRGAARKGISCREVGERMITRDSDVTRMLDRLEARGLITRERQEDDRRVVLTFITAEGLAILKELERPVKALHKTQLGHLSERDLGTLSRLLKKVRAGK